MYYSYKKNWIFLICIFTTFVFCTISSASTNFYRTYDRHPCHRQLQDERTKEICGLKIYQIMVESFIDGNPAYDFNIGSGPSHHKGDLDGIIQSLPYIKSLGANAIWLTPIFDPGFEEDQWDWAKRLSATGYYIKDYFKIAPNFGDLSIARELVQKAHELDMYVFLDGVFGHHKETGVITSPQGNKPAGSSYGVSYPESLPFYKEVALYWIENLEIDGWRLDVANQVPLDSWRQINRDVQDLCKRRKSEGKKWGTLCYMVAEVWKDEQTIQRTVHGSSDNPGLESSFNFSQRYSLVKVLATQEWVNQEGAMNLPAHTLTYQYNSNDEVFADHVITNFMIGNHDLVRFGDLIQRAGYPGPEDKSYWDRHKAAFSFLAAQSGPVTIYYNDEIGFELPGYADKIWSQCENLGLCDDHVSRTSGKIPGIQGMTLTNEEEDLKNYVTLLLDLRDQYPALSNGTRISVYADDDIHMELKFIKSKEDQPTEGVLFILNSSRSAKSISIPSGLISLSSNTLVDIIQNQNIRYQEGSYVFNLPPLSSRFYKVQNALQTNTTATIYSKNSQPLLVQYDSSNEKMLVPITPKTSNYRDYQRYDIPLGIYNKSSFCLNQESKFCTNSNLFTISNGVYTISNNELVPGYPLTFTEQD